MAKRILVPLDRTVESESILPLVADVACGGGAVVRLLHVAPPPENVVDDAGRVVAYADQEMRRLEAEGLDHLRALEIHLDGVPVEMGVRFGDPTREILREADTFNADLIAVTTTGWSGIGRVLVGSVAEQVLRKAAVAVLLLRAGRDSRS